MPHVQTTETTTKTLDPGEAVKVFDTCARNVFSTLMQADAVVRLESVPRAAEIRTVVDLPDGPASSFGFAFERTEAQSIVELFTGARPSYCSPWFEDALRELTSMLAVKAYIMLCPTDGPATGTPSVPRLENAIHARPSDHAIELQCVTDAGRFRIVIEPRLGQGDEMSGEGGA